MTGLYMAEVRRFARWALVLGLLHAASLLLLDRSFPTLRDDGEVMVVAGFAYAMIGAAFGFYQAASYGRTSHWIALLHRPLAPWRIMAAITGGSATVLVLAVSGPLLVFTAALVMQADRVVDVRHWHLVASAGLLALLGLGLGSWLALAPRRYGWTVLVAPIVLIVTSAGTGASSMLLPLLVLGVLVFLLAGAFRMDRSLPPTRPSLLALTACVAAAGLYVLLAGGVGLAFQLGLAVTGRNPEIGTPPPEGPIAASRARSKDLMDAALAETSGQEASIVRAHLRSVEARRLPVAIDRMPARGELTNAGPIRFTDPLAGVEWTYSHDRNAFLGVRMADRRTSGELRPPDGFETPPLLTGDGIAIAGRTLYRLAPDAGRFERWLQLPEDDRVAARPTASGRFVAVLGERALHFIDADALERTHAPSPVFAVPLQGMVGDLLRLDLAHLPDRTLVSFVFGRDAIDGPHQAWQQVLSVAPGGSVRTLAERPLEPDYPDVLRYRTCWLSPVLGALMAVAKGMGAGAAWIPPRAPLDVPRQVWIGASLLALFSAVGTWLLGRHRGLRLRETMAWTAAAVVLGFPLLSAFWLIGWRRA